MGAKTLGRGIGGRGVLERSKAPATYRRSGCGGSRP